MTIAKNAKSNIGHKKIFSSKKKNMSGRPRVKEEVKISADIQNELAEKIISYMTENNASMKSVINESLYRFFDKYDNNHELIEKFVKENFINACDELFIVRKDQIRAAIFIMNEAFLYLYTARKLYKYEKYHSLFEEDLNFLLNKTKIFLTENGYSIFEKNILNIYKNTK